MALQENVGVRTAYKFYSSGDMVANTEADTSTDPGASSAQEIRRVSSTLTGKKDVYQSAEIRTDRQVADLRHGTKRPAGELMGELSPATYFDFMEAACRGTKSAALSKSNTEFTSMAADSGTSKFTAGGSTWAAQGFRVGDIIRFTNLSAAGNNSQNYQIISLSTVDAVVSPAPTTMTADTSFTVVTVGKKVTIPASGHVKRKLAIEHYHVDVDVTQLFTEGRITGMSLKAPATGMCEVTFPITARNQQILTGGSSPYFSSPSAANTNGITASVNGKIIFNGTAVGVITGIEFNLNMAVDAPAVVGQNIVPEIFLGRSVITGQLTALFQDSAFLAAFNSETEVSILLLLTTTSAANSPFIAFTMPRVKLSSADVPLQGEGGLPISCGFQALLMPSTTGYDNTSLTIQDSEAS